MYELTYTPTAGITPAPQPETIPTSGDAARATDVAARLTTLRATKATALADLATAAAASIREEYHHGSGVRVEGSIRTLSAQVAALEREERYFLAAYAGLTDAELLTDLDRLAAVE